jgi:trigger factor
MTEPEEQTGQQAGGQSEESTQPTPVAEPTGGSGSPYTIKVEQPEPWQRVIKVEVSAAHFRHEYQQRLRAAARQHVKPGFRRGKIPQAMVERELGPQLRAQTIEHIIPESFKTAIIEHELVPISDPEVRNLKMQDDQPISYDMAVEVRPRITATGYDDLPLQRREIEVSDREVDTVMERLRESRAVFERVDRPAANGDRLVLELVPRDESGQSQPERRVTDLKLVLGEEGNLRPFEEGLQGAEAGQTRQVSVEYPQEHPSDDLRGRAVTYDCEVREVQKKLLPELDDAFASSLEAGKTLLELRQDIRRDLRQEEERQIDRELEEQVVDRLLERNEVSVPPSLIEQYVRSGLEELHGRQAQRGVTSTPEEDEQYRKLTTPIAERILKGMFVMEAIRRQEGIKVSTEEIEERIAEIAREHHFDLEKYRDYAAQGAERDRIVHGLEERKTFDFLLSRARITTAPPAAQQEGA